MGSFLAGKLSATDKMRIEGDLGTAHLHHVRSRKSREEGAVVIDHENGLLIGPDDAENLISPCPLRQPLRSDEPVSFLPVDDHGPGTLAKDGATLFSVRPLVRLALRDRLTW